MNKVDLAIRDKSLNHILLFSYKLTVNDFDCRKIVWCSSNGKVEDVLGISESAGAAVM